jgi:hypothetical protein
MDSSNTVVVRYLLISFLVLLIRYNFSMRLPQMCLERIRRAHVLQYALLFSTPPETSFFAK